MEEFLRQSGMDTFQLEQMIQNGDIQIEDLYAEFAQNMPDSEEKYAVEEDFSEQDQNRSAEI